MDFLFCFIFKFFFLTQIHPCWFIPSTLWGQHGGESIRSIHPLKAVLLKSHTRSGNRVRGQSGR